MPAYRFYMVVPALAIVALDVVLPYGVAFKLVAVSGLVTLPFCCWAFGRLARFRYPMPELFAFAGLCFALDESFSIYGGNLKSTMAGEFSFSIALSLVILGLGLLAAGCSTGQVPRAGRRSCSPLAVVSATASSPSTSLLGGDRHRARRHRHARRLVFGLTRRRSRVVLLSAWWIGPFLGNHAVHDRHEVRRPPGGRERLVLGHVLPADRAARHPRSRRWRSIGFVACVDAAPPDGTALGVIGLLHRRRSST